LERTDRAVHQPTFAVTISSYGRGFHTGTGSGEQWSKRTSGIYNSTRWKQNESPILDIGTVVRHLRSECRNSFSTDWDRRQSTGSTLTKSFFGSHLGLELEIESVVHTVGGINTDCGTDRRFDGSREDYFFAE
jgi:hypothetical protein